MILPKQTAERLGLHVGDLGSIYTLTRDPSDAEQQAVAAELTRAGTWPRS